MTKQQKRGLSLAGVISLLESKEAELKAQETVKFTIPAIATSLRNKVPSSTDVLFGSGPENSVTLSIVHLRALRDVTEAYVKQLNETISRHDAKALEDRRLATELREERVLMEKETFEEAAEHFEASAASQRTKKRKDK